MDTLDEIAMNYGYSHFEEAGMAYKIAIIREWISQREEAEAGEENGGTV